MDYLSSLQCTFAFLKRFGIGGSGSLPSVRGKAYERALRLRLEFVRSHSTTGSLCKCRICSPLMYPRWTPRLQRQLVYVVGIVSERAACLLGRPLRISPANSGSGSVRYCKKLDCILRTPLYKPKRSEANSLQITPGAEWDRHVLENHQSDFCFPQNNGW
jgi:hypothetical protein